MTHPLDARERLFQLAQESGTSLSGLSRLIGRNTTYLQQFIRKGSPRKLEEQDRRVLAEFFGVSEDELGAPQNVGGVCGAIKTPPPLRDSPHRLRESSRAEYRAPRRRAAPAASEWVEVPRIPLGASAGPGALASDKQPDDSFRFSRRWLREMGLEGAQLSAIAVEGDSMEPLLRDGDEILVDRAQRTMRDGVHVVRLGDMLMVKRIAQAGGGKLSLLSENRAYPPIEVRLDEVEAIGRVVWKGGKI